MLVYLIVSNFELYVNYKLTYRSENPHLLKIPEKISTNNKREKPKGSFISKKEMEKLKKRQNHKITRSRSCTH